MLQIIGWLACACLVVKALEIAGSNSHRDAEGSFNSTSFVAIVLARVAAIGFAALLFVQGNGLQSATAYPVADVGTPFTRCLGEAKSAADIAECNKRR